jgi:hypothetical protein
MIARIEQERHLVLRKLAHRHVVFQLLQQVEHLADALDARTLDEGVDPAAGHGSAGNGRFCWMVLASPRGTVIDASELSWAWRISAYVCAAALLDHLVCAQQERWRYLNSKTFCGGNINYKIEPSRSLNRHFGWARAF